MPAYKEPPMVYTYGIRGVYTQVARAKAHTRNNAISYSPTARTRNSARAMHARRASAFAIITTTITTITLKPSEL